MIMFVIIIAIMSISMGVAVQTASFQMQREREAELIFRGQQYVEAIRLYKTKYGRYPMQLKELWKAKPRVIRKKWKDPITDSENWGIVFLGQDGRQLGSQGRRAGGSGLGDDDRERSDSPISTQTPWGTDRNQGQGDAESSGLPGTSGEFGQVGADRKMGPIIGVHSTSCDEAIKVYEGHTTYCEWKFVYREQQQRGGRQQQQPPVNQPPVGWHPGDRIETGPDGRPIKAPAGGNSPPDIPPGGNRPPGPVQTPGRP
jgi:type II secretory pathway pseudopilin PulG